MKKRADVVYRHRPPTLPGTNGLRPWRDVYTDTRCCDTVDYPRPIVMPKEEADPSFRFYVFVIIFCGLITTVLGTILVRWALEGIFAMVTR